MTCKQSQGAQLVDYIREWERKMKRKPTYLTLVLSGISACPWRRLSEPAAQAALRKGERLVRGKDSRGRVVFQITRRKA